MTNVTAINSQADLFTTNTVIDAKNVFADRQKAVADAKEAELQRQAEEAVAKTISHGLDVPLPELKRFTIAELLNECVSECAVFLSKLEFNEETNDYDEFDLIESTTKAVVHRALRHRKVLLHTSYEHYEDIWKLELDGDFYYLIRISDLNKANTMLESFEAERIENKKIYAKYMNEAFPSFGNFDDDTDI